MAHQTWTIGSDEACDIVVNIETVSSQHCRLSFDGTVVRLEDLGSTNGTYVNGERIQAAETVSVSDRISLGASYKLPWPTELLTIFRKPDESIITIGRGTGNAIVIDQPSVSTNHARLVVRKDQFVLEDLQSTNGTFVHSKDNEIRRTVVEIGDLFYLGDCPLRISDVVRSFGNETKCPIADPDAEQVRETNWALAGIGFFLCFLVTWFTAQKDLFFPS